MATPLPHTPEPPAPPAEPTRRRTRRRSPTAVSEARRQLRYEAISGASGLVLALFMWGHMFMVGSILTGERGFDFVASGLEHLYIAQPTVFAISALFLIHAAFASRKIPAQLRERRRMRLIAVGLRDAPAALRRGRPVHTESVLWLWQVVTGMALLVFGSFHLVLVGVDLLTPLFGERVGIEAVSSSERVRSGLWLVYLVLLLCVEFHASVGLYRLAVKWGFGARLGRHALRRIEHAVLVLFLGLGLVTLAVLAGWLAPPLAFALEG